MLAQIGQSEMRSPMAQNFFPQGYEAPAQKPTKSKAKKVEVAELSTQSKSQETTQEAPKIKKPKNSWQHFMCDYYAKIKSDGRKLTDVQAYAKAAAAAWAAMDES